jgi:glycosyltransferase involved in cell wall biosynthesis
VRVLVLGKGEHGQEQDLLARAQHAGIAAALDYRGWIEPEQIPALLAQATLALVPVDNTLINQARCSAKLLELIAAGVPVVASRVGQMVEYIRVGLNGWLVEPHQPAAFAQAVLHLLDQPSCIEYMRQHGRQTLYAYTWDRLAQQAEAACAYAVAHSS